MSTKYKLGEKYLIALTDGRDAAITITALHWIDDQLMYTIDGQSCCGRVHELVTEKFLDDSIVRGAI